jgi:serine/threonine protein kinase
MSPAFDPVLTLDEVREGFSGRFSITGRVGEGGQGELFLVEDDNASKVLKIYKNSHRVRAERECRALERLNSDNFVDLHEWGTVSIRGEDCIYTVAGFVEGTPLHQVLGERRLDEAEARRMGASIAKGIGELWACDRIVHRDIKPSNIMLRPDGGAVILDLGIAKHHNLVTYTTWGVAWGTPGYMSPEQARGRRGITYKSDLFCLGIVLYEAVAGRHPFSRRQDLIGSTDPTKLNEIAPVSSHFVDIVHRLLNRDPLDRPRTCAEVAEELEGGGKPCT